MPGRLGGGVPLPDAHTGDRVRARTSDRAAATVEGILHLRYVPGLDYVQVNVEDDATFHDVDPTSIEVLEAGAMSAEALEAADPLTGDPRWRRIRDLEAARDAGLLSEVRDFGGVTWDDMFSDLDRLVHPLVESGWETVGRERYQSWEFGDSVMFTLRRRDRRIDVELYDHGAMDVFPVRDDEGEDDDEVTPPLFHAEDEHELLTGLRAHGLLP